MYLYLLLDNYQPNRLYECKEVIIISLVSCSYCGKLHKRGTKCNSKPKVKRNKDYDKIYNSYRWQQLRDSVKKESMYFCQVCCRLEGIVVPNYSDEVHHVVPITEDISRAYDKDNLLPLCAMHHDEIHLNKLNSIKKIEEHFKINFKEENRFLK